MVYFSLEQKIGTLHCKATSKHSGTCFLYHSFRLEVLSGLLLVTVTTDMLDAKLNEILADSPQKSQNST